MIDPTNITNYNRTEEELEEFLLFCIMVAGKNAKQTAKKLDEFLSAKKSLGLPEDTSPLKYIKHLIDTDMLSSIMMKHKLGQYKRLTFAFIGILKFKRNLKNVPISELESVKGIGSKTSRFFVLHSRPDQQIAVLDTHILKWLREQGYNVPKATPPKARYTIIEKDFLTECDKAGKTPAELDLEIWKSYSQQ